MNTYLTPDEIEFLLEVLGTPQLAATRDKWKVAASTDDKLQAMLRETVLGSDSTEPKG